MISSIGTLVAIAFISFGCGTLIGATGIGGLILVPILAQFKDIDIHTSVISCMWGYIFAGIVGVIPYGNYESLPWVSAVYIAIGAALGAAVGAWLSLFQVEQFIIEMILYSVMIFSAIVALIQTFWEERAQKARQRNTNIVIQAARDEQEQQLIKEAKTQYEKELDQKRKLFRKWGIFQYIIYLLVGFIVGTLAAISGSSGPALLVPVLFVLKWPVEEAIDVSLFIQTPIAVAFTLVTLATKGNLDWILSSVVAVPLSNGVVFSSLLRKRISLRILKPFVALALLLSGLTFLILQLVSKYNQ